MTDTYTVSMKSKFYHEPDTQLASVEYKHRLLNGNIVGDESNVKISVPRDGTCVSHTQNLVGSALAELVRLDVTSEHIATLDGTHQTAFMCDTIQAAWTATMKTVTLMTTTLETLSTPTSMSVEYRLRPKYLPGELTCGFGITVDTICLPNLYKS